MQSTVTNESWVFVPSPENLALLTQEIPEEHQEEYDSLGHTHTAAGFFNRRFVVIMTKGRASKAGRPPRAPEVLGAFRITSYQADHEHGCEATLVDEESGEALQFGHVPVKLFEYPVYLSIPISQGLRWEARELSDGRIERNLVFGLCIKQQSALKWFNPRNVSVVTHNEFASTFS